MSLERRRLFSSFTAFYVPRKCEKHKINEKIKINFEVDSLLCGIKKRNTSNMEMMIASYDNGRR
jgi:hypothetical protein